MKLRSINGILYKEFWDHQKGYTRRKSLKLKDTQINRRHAQKLLHLTEAENYYTDASTNYIKLTQALQIYLEYKNPKPKTRQLYTQAVNHLIESAGDKFIQDYTHKDYVLLLTHFRKQKKYLLDHRSYKKEKKFIIKSLSQNSQSIYSRTLKALFNYFVKHKQISENIIEALPPGDPHPTPIDLDDLEKILNALKRIPHQYALTYFLVNTGIRKSTALDLCWDDIDWKNNLITFRNIKIKGKYYQFPFIPRLKTILKTLGPQKTGKVFPYKNESGLIFFKRVQDHLNLKRHYSIHKLKHTFVSQLVNAGMSLEDVSELTNTSLRTLKKNYLKMDKKRIADKLQSIKIAG